MASNQTEHYGLNQWAGEDSFLRSEFNEDNRRIDAALSRCEPAFGSYDGTYDGTSNGTQIIELGFRPKAVLVLPFSGSQGSSSAYTSGAALAIDGNPAGTLVITDTGFQVSGHSNMKNRSYMDFANKSPYRYIAWR